MKNFHLKSQAEKKLIPKILFAQIIVVVIDTIASYKKKELLGKSQFQIYNCFDVCLKKV